VIGFISTWGLTNYDVRKGVTPHAMLSDDRYLFTSTGGSLALGAATI
jgi:hypothetical protein